MVWSDWQPSYEYESSGHYRTDLVYRIDRYIAEPGPAASVDKAAAIHTAVTQILAGNGTNVSGAMPYNPGQFAQNFVLTVMEMGPNERHVLGPFYPGAYAYDQTGGAVIDIGYTGNTYKSRSHNELPSYENQAPPSVDIANLSRPPFSTTYTNWGVDGYLDFEGPDSTFKHWAHFGGPFDCFALGYIGPGEYGHTHIPYRITTGPLQTDTPPGYYQLAGRFLPEVLLPSPSAIKHQGSAQVQLNADDGSQNVTFDISDVTDPQITLYIVPDFSSTYTSASSGYYVPSGAAYTIYMDVGGMFPTGIYRSPRWRYWIPQASGIPITTQPRGTGRGNARANSTNFWR